MDYAIYKSINDSHSHIVHRFTQADNNHRAMAAARKKLDEMWRRVLGCQPLYKNAESLKDGFAYDYMTSVNTTERIRFYIAPLKKADSVNHIRKPAESASHL